jgi:hypothetical protein
MIHRLDLSMNLERSERPVTSVPTSPKDPGPTSHPPQPGTDLTVPRTVIAVLWTIVIMMLCWLPSHVVQRVEAGSGWLKIVNLDKAIHSAIFLVFAFLWARVSSSPRRFAWVAIGGIVFAAVTELGQLIPVIERDATVADLLADCAGVLTGIVAFPWVEPWFQLVESRLLREDRSGQRTPTPPDAARWSQ